MATAWITFLVLIAFAMCVYSWVTVFRVWCELEMMRHCDKVKERNNELTARVTVLEAAVGVKRQRAGIRRNLP